jgi:hypothetical protein
MGLNIFDPYSNYPTKKIKIKIVQQYKNITHSYRNLFAEDAIATAGKITASVYIGRA